MTVIFPVISRGRLLSGEFVWARPSTGMFVKEIEEVETQIPNPCYRILVSDPTNAHSVCLSKPNLLIWPRELHGRIGRIQDLPVQMRHPMVTRTRQSRYCTSRRVGFLPSFSDNCIDSIELHFARKCNVKRCRCNKTTMVYSCEFNTSFDRKCI